MNLFKNKSPINYAILIICFLLNFSCSQEKNYNAQIKGNTMGTYYFIEVIDVFVARFALGAAIGKSNFDKRFNAISLLGILHPTKFKLFDKKGEIFESLFFSNMSVNGPGQKILAS